VTSATGIPQPAIVLIVDDEEMIRELARAVLESSGVTVLDEAADGVAALERYRAADPPQIPNVVLLDNRMPGMSGLEVAAEMLGEFPTQIVVLFSAHLDPTVTAEAQRLGITACVSKQDVTKLPTIIDGLLGDAARN
jgi:two-component system, chemotaxis family, chemotaxis protein CheY